MYRFIGIMACILIMFGLIWANQPEAIAPRMTEKEDATDKESSTSDNAQISASDNRSLVGQPEKAKSPAQKEIKMPSYNKLSDNEQWVLLKKGTERAGTGEYEHNKAKGTYICRQCNAALYLSDHKFASGCGWPAFDDEIEGAVLRKKETDGTGRVEIVCNNCKGHLGHVFLNEGFTSKNTRHCVNSVSMKFIAEGEELPKKIVLSE